MTGKINNFILWTNHSSNHFFDRYRKWILLGIGAIGIIICFFVILFVVNFVKDRLNSGNEILEEADRLMARDLNECDGDSNCENAVRVNTARELGSLVVCEGLENDAFDNCAYLIAIDQVDVDICDAMNEEVSDCKDTIYIKLANQNDDYTICDDVSDEDSQRSCYANHIAAIQAAGQCEELGVNSLCVSRALMDEIAAADSPAICDTLDSGYDHLCFELFEAKDRDEDGLNALEEYNYGTSDYESDTDGDGYSDKVEVDNGFDPLSG